MPDVVIAVSLNREGGEDSSKLAKYAEIGVRHYVIFDPEQHLGADIFRAFRLEVYSYEKMAAPVQFLSLGLGLQLWNGHYEGR